MDVFVDELTPDIVAHLKSRSGSRRLEVTRYSLADVLACERYFENTTDQEFEWSVTKSRGTIASTLVRRWYFRGPNSEPEPAEDPIAAVHALFDELEAEGESLGLFVGGLTDSQRADLAAGAMEVISGFEESWPASLRPRNVWSPYRLKPAMFGGGLRMKYVSSFRFGKPLTLEDGVHEDAVLLDVRPGEEFEEDERPTRWYAALLELIQVHVAPKRVVTWYAPSRQTFAEDVSEILLELAARRTANGIRRMVEVGTGVRDPSRNPGWRCRRCALVDDCEVGATWLASN